MLGVSQEGAPWVASLSAVNEPGDDAHSGHTGRNPGPATGPVRSVNPRKLRVDALLGSRGGQEVHLVQKLELNGCIAETGSLSWCVGP